MDTYRTNLQAMIEAKVEGRAVVETPEAKSPKVVDIMDALERSLGRKPAATAKVEHGELPKRRKRA